MCRGGAVHTLAKDGNHWNYLGYPLAWYVMIFLGDIFFVVFSCMCDCQQHFLYIILVILVTEN